MQELQKVFDFQRQLMEKLAPVERELGYTPPQIPLDFTQRAHQDWFRLMSWYLTEEITEARVAAPEDEAEELADCLHFAVELCILAGVTPSEVESFSVPDLFDYAPSYSLMDVLISLGQANNLLKAKHWKRNPEPVKEHAFKLHLARMAYTLIRHMHLVEIDPYEEYFKKHKENEDRIQRKY